MRIRNSDLFSWLEQGRVPASFGAQAARTTGLLPAPPDWRSFADRFLLWVGSLFLAFAVIFFIAYNWQALGRFAKFGLAEGALILAVVAAWRLGVERLTGRAALFAVALLIGALLALVGQTYQTGADTFELFSAWALAILPLALLASMPALWLLWLAIVNLAVVLYFQAFQGILFSFLFERDPLPWALFTLNAIALVAWEAAALAFDWARVQWARRCVAFASGAAAAVLAVFGAVDDHVNFANLLAWSAWTAAAYYWYRYRRPDLFVLAGGVLGAVVVLTAWLSRAMLFDAGDEGAAFLLIGLLVISLSAAGSYWLRAVARELNA
jgi:uncharacterized membrane protein